MHICFQKGIESLTKSVSVVVGYNNRLEYETEQAFDGG